IGIDGAGFFQREFQLRVLNVVLRWKNRLHRVYADHAGLLVEFATEVLLALVLFARSRNNGVFHRTDHNLRFNALFSSKRINDVVIVTCYSLFSCSSLGSPDHRITRSSNHPILQISGARLAFSTLANSISTLAPG